MSDKKVPTPPRPGAPEEDVVQFGDELPVLPIRNAVLFPGAVAPLFGNAASAFWSTVCHTRAAGYAATSVSATSIGSSVYPIGTDTLGSGHTLREATMSMKWNAPMAANVPSGPDVGARLRSRGQEGRHLQLDLAS
jgi:hypothetical protein